MVVLGVVLVVLWVILVFLGVVLVVLKVGLWDLGPLDLDLQWRC